MELFSTSDHIVRQALEEREEISQVGNGSRAIPNPKLKMRTYSLETEILKDEHKFAGQIKRSLDKRMIDGVSPNTEDNREDSVK